MDGLNSENSLTFHLLCLIKHHWVLILHCGEPDSRLLLLDVHTVGCEAITVFIALKTGAVSGPYAASLQTLTDNGHYKRRAVLKT